MIVNGKTIRITNSVISYESGISWKSVNKRMSAIDYGLDTDHVSAKISVWGSVKEITEFRNAMPKVSDYLIATFDKGEKPFGPAFNCESEGRYLLIDIDEITTKEKGIAQMPFQLAALWTTLVPSMWPPTPHPWAYHPIEFDLANFAVQEVKRESGEDKSVFQKESGWQAARHGWSRPKFTLSLLANSATMGGTIEWLLKKRSRPFSVSCNASMKLLDSQSVEVLSLSFGNLRRLGISDFWQAEFDFVRAT